MSDVTLPASRVDFLDPRTGKVSADWYRYFQQSYVRIGGPTYAISVVGAGLTYSAGAFTINSTPANTPSTIVYRDASGNFSAGTITAALSGNAATSSKWVTARTLSFSGDATGTGSVDGSADVATGLTLASTGVPAGSYGSATRATLFTVDAKGRLTAASDALITPAFGSITGTPTTATGYGIASIDAVPIGSTTPSTGAFSTLSAAGLTDLSAAGAGQVKFPATANLSANANTLDAYAEGTWTPVLAFGGASVGMTYSLQTGAYTRIGNRVFFTGRVTLTAKGASTGAATITGLPFTSANVTGQASACMVFVNNVAATMTAPNANNSPNTSTLLLFQLTAGVNTALQDTDFTNTTVITVSGHYAA